ncbi:MAG: xanthine phosphoribosyltransferase [Acidimicrobiia bacterium]|nr:xanthine phosphoribosyltransferase [Acidimicrobiia bacterium]
MQLREAIETRARVEGSLLKVDDFLNHRVDIDLFPEIGREIAERFADAQPDLILTAEASGIPPGMVAAEAMGIPMVYAKKYVGVGERYTFAREVSSPTKGTEYRVEVARRVLPPGLRVAIVDDFLAGGRTAEALGEIVEEAGGEVLGFVFVVEKTFTDGRQRLEAHGWSVDALVGIASLENGVAVLEPE